MPVIDINELPKNVQEDICANLLEEVPFLRHGDFDISDVRDNLLGLAERVPVQVGLSSTHSYEIQAGKRMVSEAAIRSLSIIRDQLVVEGKELDPILISKDQFIDGGHRFELWRRKGLIQFPSVDIHNLITMDWESWLEGSDMPVPEPEPEPEPDSVDPYVRLPVFHGSFWIPGETDGDEHVFTEPDGAYNDFGVTYFTNDQKVAEWFSSYNLTAEDSESGALEIILKGTLLLKNTIRKEAHDLQSNPQIEIGGSEPLNITDREALYNQLRAHSVSALIIGDEYSAGDDIAVLSSGSFECEAVALKKPDGTFTEFLDPERARSLFLRHVNQFTFKREINNEPEL